MIKTHKYRIVNHTFYDKFNVSSEYYTVQYEWKFIIWKFWSTLKELDCSWGDCCKSAVKFKSESDAVNAVNKLVMGNILEGEEKKVISVINFKGLNNLYK